MRTPETKRVFNWGMTWRDAAECAWLSEQAAQGWHLKKVNIFYYFEKGELADLVYTIAAPPVKIREDIADYIQICQDAGWALACHNGLARFYFYANAQGTQPTAVFADTPTKIAKYTRVLKSQLLFLLLVASSFFTMFNAVVLHENRPQWFMVMMVPLLLLLGIVLLLLIDFAFVTVFKIQRLKRQEGQT